MGEIIMPEINMIYNIREELRQDPIYWALSLSIAHVIVTNHSMDARIIRQWEKDKSFSDEDSLLFIIEEDGEIVKVAAFAVEDNTGLYVRVISLQGDYYFKVEKNSYFQSLDVVTEESFKHDARLLKLIKDPSWDTLKKFGIEKKVRYRPFNRERNLIVEQAKVDDSLLDE